ncbi:MAG: hypothetical protein MRZ79_00915 [Bacteroidia bacterium]|nr:hypothetical protein [Bacteroidia bacterium]
MLPIQIFIWLLYAYMIIGVLVGAWFLATAAAKIDEDIRGAKWYTKLLLFPGAVALWPVLLRKALNHKN